MTRVFLCQPDHYRHVLSFFIDNTGGFKVAGACHKSIELETQLHLTQPGLVLLDIALEKGIDMLVRIRKHAPTAKVIVLTETEDPAVVLQCLALGAAGYLLVRKTNLPRLIDFIRDACEGGVPISPALVKHIVKALPPGGGPVVLSTTLTRRETEILQLMVNGQTYKAISFSLNIALDTVRSHIRNIYDKLEVHSKSEAVVKALRERIAVPY
jgi:DNA-binding NarL/FixJ family response regulator